MRSGWSVEWFVEVRREDEDEAVVGVIMWEVDDLRMRVGAADDDDDDVLMLRLWVLPVPVPRLERIDDVELFRTRVGGCCGGCGGCELDEPRL